MDTADVVVIGAGANGTSTAFHLAKAGVKKVVVLEQSHLASGATGKSGALVRMHYTNEPETRLAVESFKYFENWNEMVGGDCGLNQIGLFVFTPPDRYDDLEANVAMQREVGAETYLLSADEAAEIDSSVSFHDVSHVAYEPRSGYADPSATVYSLARAAMGMGVDFRFDTPVTRILTEGDRVTGVETANGVIQTSSVVVAAGAWANKLFQPIGITLPLEPKYARVSVFRWSFDRPEKHMTYIDRINGTWSRPTDGNCTLIGAEIGVRETDDPDNYQEAPSQDYINHCRQQLINRFPVMRHSTMRGTWAGILMRSGDSRPLIGALDQYQGLYCMTGDSGTSFKTSPAIGKCLSELVTDGRSTTVDLTPFRPSRFDEGKPWVDEHNYGADDEDTISR
ncbi:MAG: FAD-binding oxidoreductase [Sphaerobacteraceae bacterium]|nr:MAG: FAD-binding oxidoreductase [Sphaerobacteraceae bacterium]